LIYPYPKEYCEYLLSIKRGEHSIEEISALISDGVDKLKTLSLSSKLPECNAELTEKFNIWFLEWLKKFYSLKDC